MNDICLFDKVTVSERDDGCLDLLIRICGDGVNKNGKALDFNAEESIKTLINQPLQAKIKRDSQGNEDFTGHNRKKVYVRDNQGNVKTETILDTVSIGTFTDAYVEEEDGKSYIYGKCLMWGNRYKKAKEIILERFENGELKGSWEVIPIKKESAVIDGKKCELFTEFSFIGHCLLGKNVTPAYDEAQILEVAEEEMDEEFSSALAQDINKLDDKEGIEDMSKENKGQKEVVETSALTMNDLRRKLCQMTYEIEREEDYWLYDSIIYPTENTAYFSKEGSNCLEGDYLKVIYSIDENDNLSIVSKEDVKMTFVPAETVVEVSELEAVKAELSEKVASIVILGKVITEKDVVISEKDKTITELEVFKAQIAEIEKAEAEKQLAAKKDKCKAAALSSGYFTEADIEASEELKEAIEAANEDKVMICIAAAVLKSNAGKVVEVSEKEEESKEEIETSTHLENDYDYGESDNPIINYIKTKKSRRR